MTLLAGGAVLLCIAGLLAVPVEIEFAVKRKEKLEGFVCFIWMFGLVRREISSDGGKEEEAGGEAKAETKPKKKSKSRWRGRLMKMATAKTFLARLARYVRDVTACVRIYGVRLDARIGTGDPADTGMLWGFIGPAELLLAGLSNIRSNIKPEFNEEILELDGEGRVRVIPLRVLAATFLFLLSPAVIKMAWELAR